MSVNFDNYNFDDLAIRLANFSNKAKVDLSGKTEEKVQKTLNIIYETIATSTSKNLIDRRQLLEKAESIVQEVAKTEKNTQEMVALCHDFLRAKRQEVTKELAEVKKERNEQFIKQFQTDVAALFEEILILKHTPRELTFDTINRKLDSLFSGLPVSVIKALIAQNDQIFLNAKALFFETLPAVLKYDFSQRNSQIIESIQSAIRLDKEAAATVLESRLSELLDVISKNAAEAFLKVPVQDKKFENALQICLSARLAIQEIGKLIKSIKQDFNLDKLQDDILKIDHYAALQVKNRALLSQSDRLKELAHEFLHVPPEKLSEKIEAFAIERISFLRNLVAVKRELPDFNPMHSEPLEGHNRFLEAIKKFQGYSMGAMSKAQADAQVATVAPGKMFLYFSTDDNGWMLASCHLEAGQKQAVHSKIAVHGILSLEKHHASGMLLVPQE